MFDIGGRYGGSTTFKGSSTESNKFNISAASFNAVNY